MKHSLKYILLGFLLVPSVFFAQTKGEELLPWSASRQLTWADYKAAPNTESDAAASTTTYLSIDYNIGSKNFSYKIRSLFSKTRSWGLHQTDYILRHEQGHFDIAEVFARKLFKKMNEYKFNRKTYKKDLKKIYDEVTTEKEETQNLYDEETNHSIKRRKQGEWLKKISAMLEEYKDYANY
ncbi:MAG: DUF922 domain-containing protein [Bacteroidota bacterium]